MKRAKNFLKSRNISSIKTFHTLDDDVKVFLLAEFRISQMPDMEYFLRELNNELYKSNKKKVNNFPQDKAFNPILHSKSNKGLKGMPCHE